MSLPTPESVLGKRNHGQSEQVAPEPNKLFQCSECRKSYSRVDHLARHVRLHTNEKPYPCTICGKSFARADLLKRHIAGHNARGDHEHARKNTVVRPGRVSKACEACAELHLRCDEQKPCTRCKKKTIACVYNSTPPPEAEVVDRSSQNLTGTDNSATEPILVDAPFTARPDMMMPPGRSESFSVTQDFTTQGSAMAENVDYMPMPIPPAQFPPQIHPESSDPNFTNDYNAMHEFLQNVMGGGDHFLNSSGTGQMSGTWTPRNVFEFGQDTNLELNDLDLGFLNDYNNQNPFASYVESPDTTLSAKGSVASNPPSALGGETLQRASTWRFRPANSSAQQNLTLPETDSHKKLQVDRRVTVEPLSYIMRDRILGIFVSTCKPSDVPRSLLCFPSLGLLDSLLQFYLASKVAIFAGLFHLPTLRPSSMRPELVGAMIAAGATLTPDRSLQKIGFALQESLRSSVPSLFEDNNSLIADLEILQSMGICLGVGLWSGNSRKMEIAESFLQPFVTMVRRRGWFLKSAYETIVPLADDHGQQLEDKWEAWIKQESRKRLVLFFFLHGTRQSISLFTNPLISYAELAMPLPAVKELWSASSAVAWKSTYLALGKTAVRTPSVVDLLRDVDLLSEMNPVFDVNMACEALLSAAWGLIWDYRQLSSITRGQATQWSGSSWLLSSRLTELTKLLDCIRMSCPSSPPITLFLELLRMHLYVSLEEVHLFAGAEGHEEARRVYPLLQDWAKTPESRDAVAHAARIVSAARKIGPGCLRDFYAIAVYQASLTLWSYGVVSNANEPGSSEEGTGSGSAPPPPAAPKRSDDVAVLDGPDSGNVQRFVAMNRGHGAITTGPGDKPDEPFVLLSNPGAVMNVLIGVLKVNHKSQQSLPPLVSNLISLMEGLGMAVSGTSKES